MAPYWYAGGHEPIAPRRRRHLPGGRDPPAPQVIGWSRWLLSVPRSTRRRLGLDRARLGFIGRHFDRYVEDRKLPGFLAVVTRHGKVAHVVGGWLPRSQDGRTGRDHTRFRIYSMTKPITSRGDDLLRARLDRP